MAEDEATHSIDASMRTFLGDLELPGLQPGMQDEEIASIMFEHARESKDYFVGSRKWKNLLDMVLREYRHCMIVSFQKERSEIRPKNHRNKYPSVSTLLARRSSLYYWVLEKCRNPPDHYRFNKATTQTIQYMLKKMGVQTQEYKKPYFGKAELQIMIDDDMSQPIVKIQYVEQQHLAWIFGCICGIRPGSLGTHDSDESQYLRWKDITIRREITSDGHFEGRFSACISFKCLKSRNIRVHRPNRYQQLRLTVRSARSPDHIPFSLPHRLLTILIRRGLLRDISSVEELFNNELMNVAIKPEAMDYPVFLKSMSGQILLDSPLNTNGFSHYMKK
ncbi:MAG: hypothetical protein LQ349_008949, partial [Xanthoria aureola]